jgi:hypothetical protein
MLINDETIQGIKYMSIAPSCSEHGPVASPGISAEREHKNDNHADHDQNAIAVRVFRPDARAGNARKRRIPDTP